MNIRFWKMHGASNDFVLIDDREETFPLSNVEWIRKAAARRTGIGCEGIILIQNSDKADFRMRFINPDGSEVEMCGNGARCVARLASEIGAAPGQMAIDTVAGILRAAVRGEDVELRMTEPRDWRVDESLEIEGESIRYSSVNTGVPHVVVEVDDLSGYDVAKRGGAIRYHSAFAPAGTNANFIQVTGDSELKIRTYERGVEAETLACGTGIVASALVAERRGRVKAPVSVRAAGGDTLTVSVNRTGDGKEEVMLLGPAEHVYRGELEYEV